MSADRGTPAERLQMTLALFEFAEAQMRQRLHRERPGASLEEIEGLMRDWLHHRPGAEHGDAPGRPVPWPRRR
jgi:hypothetical protein